ncbi:hypothetical protein RSAG8_02509, partial [Rhizoctonia solani AG-8 WAC10335]
MNHDYVAMNLGTFATHEGDEIKDGKGQRVPNSDLWCYFLALWRERGRNLTIETQAPDVDQFLSMKRLHDVVRNTTDLLQLVVHERNWVLETRKVEVRMANRIGSRGDVRLSPGVDASLYSSETLSTVVSISPSKKRKLLGGAAEGIYNLGHPEEEDTPGQSLDPVSHVPCPACGHLLAWKRS